MSGSKVELVKEGEVEVKGEIELTCLDLTYSLTRVNTFAKRQSLLIKIPAERGTGRIERKKVRKSTILPTFTIFR